MKKRKKKAEAGEEVTVTISKVSTRRVTVKLLGQGPGMICHALSPEVRRALLFPPAKKNEAEKRASLKHKPLDEYRGSMYKTNKGPTRIYQPAVSFKKGIAATALDIPGATKAQIGRLTWAVGDNVAIHGIPQMFMAVTRNSDPGHTPDVRTRAILPEWCCEITIEFLHPTLKEMDVVNLLAAAGIINGVGDFRQQKGAGNYGQFIIVGTKELPTWKRIAKAGSRAAQDKAIAKPGYYDIETEELYEWFVAEVKRRGMKPKEPKDE